jgi:two-component system sensor histidine kinase/response regulator
LGDLQGVDLMAKLTELFGRDGTATMGDLRAALDRGDRVALEHAVHKLKGAAANIGAARVAALCLQLEVATGGVPDVAALDDLDGEIDLALTALRDWVSVADTSQADQPAHP